MKAEQRTSIRRKISLPVVINHDFSYSKRWKVRDLSLGGAMIEMDREELVPGTMIEAVLALKEREQYGLYRFPADVVRVDKDGVALRFRRYDNEAYTALVKLLYSS